MATISVDSSARPVSALLAARILEDADLIAGMLALVPAGSEDWRPADWPLSTDGTAPFTIGRLHAHLAESLAGVCGCLYRLHPVELSHLNALRERFHEASIFDALRRAAAQGFALVTDAELTQRLPTVFSPEGAPFLETLLINWKHLEHHAYQLFLYLKLLGVPVSTRQLYRFRPVVAGKLARRDELR